MNKHRNVRSGWNAAQQASERALPKARKLHGTVGAKQCQYEASLRDRDENEGYRGELFAGVDGSYEPATCADCGYHVCACDPMHHFDVEVGEDEPGRGSNGLRQQPVALSGQVLASARNASFRLMQDGWAVRLDHVHPHSTNGEGWVIGDVFAYCGERKQIFRFNSQADQLWEPWRSEIPKGLYTGVYRLKVPAAAGLSDNRTRLNVVEAEEAMRNGKIVRGAHAPSGIRYDLKAGQRGRNQAIILTQETDTGAGWEPSGFPCGYENSVFEVVGYQGVAPTEGDREWAIKQLAAGRTVIGPRSRPYRMNAGVLQAWSDKRVCWCSLGAGLPFDWSHTWRLA